jgi:hypothetical protein
MSNIIAEIRLAPGEVGYYDDYSRIYLSTQNPSAYVYAGTNTVQIRKSVQSGRLRLISGSLFGEPEKKVEIPKTKKEVKKEATAVNKTVEEVPAVEEVPEVKEAPVVEETPVEEVIVEETPTVEEIVEEIKTEETAEDKPKRRRSRKKTEE